MSVKTKKAYSITEQALNKKLPSGFEPLTKPYHGSVLPAKLWEQKYKQNSPTVW